MKMSSVTRSGDVAISDLATTSIWWRRTDVGILTLVLLVRFRRLTDVGKLNLTLNAKPQRYADVRYLTETNEQLADVKPTSNLTQTYNFVT